MKPEDNQCVRVLRDRIATGKTSASAICAEALGRVVLQNTKLGILTDVLATSARGEAEDIDRQVSAGKPVGILAGIPFVIKDNIDTVPAVCSAGLPSLSCYRPVSDAAVVARLREQGAVVVGVAATDSGAFGVVTPSVKNPNFPGRIAGGSSGGSAAAVAAGFCKVAIGTDTGGSIRIPAACCGIVGLKPTFGRIPTKGVRPLSVSADHVGPLGRCVADLRPFLEAFPGAQDREATELHRPMKVGIPIDYFLDASREVKRVVEDVAQRCVELGHRVQTVRIPSPDEIIPSHLILSLSEAARFHLETARKDIPTYPVAARESVLLGQTYFKKDREAAVGRRYKFASQINAAFSQVDFLLLPTLPVLPPETGEVEVKVGNQKLDILQALIRYVAGFDQSGHPALALPWRASISNTIGSVQLIGRLDADLELLNFSEHIEQLDASTVRSASTDGHNHHR